MNKSDELNFMRYNEYFYWIGATYSADHNGSAVSWDQLSLLPTENRVKCLAYSQTQGFSDEACKKKNLYICKQQLI
ncbi:natural killer cells antigen CD94-like [Talpa occidentalis]|uniref:natural killer cells antigen CD94-like n=1 Tax=Talpa occidentalis TaxID=50954 RepID=UPI0023FA1A7E|nr:natural killer cells antigen CD94-like [Talpa occidentalis]